ncbi:DUF6402 family protein [Chitinophagaceae bacterium MMS25-I14]
MANLFDNAADILSVAEVTSQNYITDTDVLDTQATDDDAAGGGGGDNSYEAGTIIINGRKVTSQEIMQRQAAVRKSIDPKMYANLSPAEKLIIDLPLIMLKLGWPYSAYCQVHWLEGSKEAVEVPYEFATSVTRAKDAEQDLVKDIKGVSYASWYDYVNYSGKTFTSGSSNFLLYNIDLSSVDTAYHKALPFLQGINDFGDHTFGNFNMDETPPKMNFVRSYVIGSAVGDKDDVGASFGRFSMRVYAKGAVTDQDFNSADYRQLYLKLTDVGYRFFDEFSFNDEQSLGYWNPDINKASEPARFSLTAGSGWVEIANKDYRRLRQRNIGLGGDFNLQTKLMYLSNSVISKTQNIIFFIQKT